MPGFITPPLSGSDLGFASGTKRIKIICGSGDPSNAGTDSTAGDLASCAVGSLYLRADGTSGHTLYVLEVSGWIAK